MQPIRYDIDVKSPFEQSINGFQIGSAIAEMNAKRQMAEQQREQQLLMQQDLSALANNPEPTARDYAKVMTKYPQISEHLKRGYDVLNPAQQQARLSSATQVFAAVNAGQPEIALRLLNEEETALRNSGMDKEANAAKNWAQVIQSNPSAARASMGLMLSSIAGADKFAQMYPALGKEGRDAEQAPAELALKTANARKAQIDAKYGEQKALGDLERQGWDIQKIQNDMAVSRENSRIAAMNAELNRETNALKRQELEIKISEANRKREDAIRETAGKAESARFNTDNMLNTIDRILKNPALNDVVGSLEGGAAYPNSLAAMTPFGSSMDQRNDAIALIETLGSQAFLSQIPQIKGTGQLSNVEGDKLQAAFQNLGRKQSETQFKASLAEAQRLLLKARRNIAALYGIPDTKPDRPASDSNPPPRFMDFNK